MYALVALLSKCVDAKNNGTPDDCNSPDCPRLTEKYYDSHCGFMDSQFYLSLLETRLAFSPHFHRQTSGCKKVQLCVYRKSFVIQKLPNGASTVRNASSTSSSTWSGVETQKAACAETVLQVDCHNLYGLGNARYQATRIARDRRLIRSLSNFLFHQLWFIINHNLKLRNVLDKNAAWPRSSHERFSLWQGCCCVTGEIEFLS